MCVCESKCVWAGGRASVRACVHMCVCVYMCVCVSLSLNEGINE